MAIRFQTGNLLDSDAQTLVNTVNCVGVMGKGIALEFRKRYPAMYRRYVELCKQGEVRLGRPYVDSEPGRLIINFPTKGHWKARSRPSDVRAGLQYLRRHISQWGVTSIALPPLGCGNGGLDWSVVRALIVRELEDIPIEVEIYEPRSDDAAQFASADSHSQLPLFDASH